LPLNAPRQKRPSASTATDLARHPATNADITPVTLTRVRRPRLQLALVALILALVVGAMLARIIQPQLSSSRRSDAMSSLLRAQILQEHWQSAHGRFGSVQDIWPHPEGLSLAGHYVLSDATGVLPGGPSEQAYAMQATPRGRQANDPCGTFVVTQAGVLLEAPWAGAACWSR